MAAYIYVPTTWAFALMLFGGTLYNRKIIGDRALGGGFAGVTLATLLTTVIMQEVGKEPLRVARAAWPRRVGMRSHHVHVHVHVPVRRQVYYPEPASTQKLWIPCPAAPAGSWDAWAEGALDMSALAKSMLALLERARG